MCLMLVIRREQMAVFADEQVKLFENKMVSYIATEYPKKYMKWGEARTRDLIRKGFLTGKRNGITKENAVIGLIELIVQFGAEFELSPEQKWAQEVMAHPSLPGDAKIQIIEERFYELTQGKEVERSEDDES